MDSQAQQEDKTPLDEAPTRTVLREVFDEAKELVRLEVEIAKSEVELELSRTKRAAVALGIGIATGVVVLCLSAVALVLALGGTAVTALVLAGALLCVGGAATLVGYSLLPTKPLHRTRRRVQSDVRELKEHIA